jgi:hypothetical protein
MLQLRLEFKVLLIKLHPSVTLPKQSYPAFSHYFWQNSINTKSLIFQKLLVRYYLDILADLPDLLL